MGSIETLLVVGAGAGFLFSIAGYLKRHKQGEKFSWGKFIGTGLMGAISGMAKYVPILGEALTSIGGVAAGKKIVKVIQPRKLPKTQ